jgi:hypothetical protein
VPRAYFHVLRVTPLAGRTFRTDEARTPAAIPSPL